MDIPRSVYLLEKWATLDDTPLKSVLLDICPVGDHYVFPENSTATHCPVVGCGHERSSSRVMLVGGVDNFLKEFFKQKDLAKVFVHVHIYDASSLFCCYIIVLPTTLFLLII